MQTRRPPALAKIRPRCALVVSDFHLGARLHRDVLTHPTRSRPCSAIAGVDRLVLLGDVVELLEGRPAEAMDIAELVLRAIGRRPRATRRW